MNAGQAVRMLKTVGVIVLLGGISSAGFVYRLGQSPATVAVAPGDWQDSSLTMLDSKTATRNIELYGGKVEVLMVKVLDWAQRPASLALLIATVAVLVALSCFLVAGQLSSCGGQRR